MRESLNDWLSSDAAWQLASLLIRQLIVAAAMAALVAYWARQRGYSGLLWFLAAFPANPGVLICFLAALPDRGLNKLRAQKLQWLEEDLQQAAKGEDSLG